MPTIKKRSHRRKQENETRFDILDYLIDPRRHDISDFEVRRSFHQDEKMAVSPYLREAFSAMAEDGLDAPADWGPAPPATTWTDIKRHLRKKGVTDSKTISRHLGMLRADGLIVKTPGNEHRDVYRIAQGYSSARHAYGFLVSFVSSAHSRTEFERRESVVRDFLASQYGCGQVDEKFVDDAAWALSVEWVYKFIREVRVLSKRKETKDGSSDRLKNREEPGDTPIDRLTSVYEKDQGSECAPKLLTGVFPPYIDAVVLDLIEQNCEPTREDVCGRLKGEGEAVCDALKRLFVPQHETGRIVQVLRRSPIALELMLRIQSLTFDQLGRLTLKVQPELFIALKKLSSSPHSARRLLSKVGYLDREDVESLFSAASRERAAFLTFVSVAQQLYDDYQRLSPLLLILSCCRAIDRVVGTEASANGDGLDFDLFTELSAIPYDMAKSSSPLHDFELDSDIEFLQKRGSGAAAVQKKWRFSE